MTVEMNKVFKDVKGKGYGIFNIKTKKRVDPEDLSIIINGDCKDMRPELSLRKNLKLIENVYKEKFGNDCPYDLELFKKDEGLFVERLIRAVEICSLRYVLRMRNGALNTCKKLSMVKGRRMFLWEH